MAELTEGTVFEEVARRGRAIYEQNLKAQLEPAHNGKAIAIHVDTGDYALGENWAVARQRLRALHPKGMIASFTIGPATDNDFALANRLAAGQKA
jgi:hypothetical protein